MDGYGSIQHGLRLLKFIVLVFGAMCVHPVAGAQVPDMQFTDPINDIEFNNEEGTCILQDDLGFIWIGTTDGLYRYDGSKLTEYNHESTDTTSLVDDNIKRLYLDSSGRLWVGTFLGLCIYNREYDNFERIVSDAGYAGLNSLYISDINEDSQKNIYVATGNHVMRYDPDSGNFQRFFSIGSGLINTFFFDREDNLWVAASEEGGLTCFDTSRKTAKTFRQGERPGGLSSNNIRDIVLDGADLWIATYGGGINRLDTKTGEVKKYPAADEYAGYVTYLYIDREKNIWSCDLTGLKLYDKQNDSFYGYYHNVEDRSSVKKMAVAIMQDRQHNYWTIHAPGGLVGVRYVPRGFEKIDKNRQNFWHTHNDNITAIEFDDAGNWWLGNGFNGIDVFDWEYGGVISYQHDEEDPFSLGQGAIHCIFKDGTGRMWIGSNFGGLQYFDEANDRFYSYKNDPSNPHSVAGNDIRSIVEDKNGDLWMSVHGKGVDRFDRKEEKFYHYDLKNNNLSNDWTFQLLIDADENLWVATSWGLSKLEKGNDVFATYHYNRHDTATLPHNFINCLYEDSKGQVWIGTTEGICRYLPGSDGFDRVEFGMMNPNICSIEEDKQGFFWISTKSGISKVEPETGKVIGHFDASDGLLDGVYNYSASACNGSHLVFGGQNGLSVFDPEKIDYNTTAPEVYITGFYLFNQPVKSYGPGSVLKRNMIDTREVVLRHNQNSIGFEFTSTNYINPQKNRFRYQLEGIDQAWVEIENERRVFYNYLPHGDYTFRVMASNNDGIWNEEAAIVEVIINHPWWLSWWMKTTVVVLILLLIALVIRWRTAVLERDKRLLEKKIGERTRSLKEKNEMLIRQKDELRAANQLLRQNKELIEQQSEELKEKAKRLEQINSKLVQTNATKDKLFSIISHDLVNPFNVIMGFTGELTENFNRIDDHQKYTLLGYINESSKSAFNLLQNLLHWSRSQKGKIDFNPVKANLAEIVETVLEDVSFMALNKNIEIEPHLNGMHEVVADTDMMNLVLRNLVINAIKFSNDGGKIWINATGTDDGIVFSVRDEGVGMDEETVRSLFGPRKNGSANGTLGEKGVGLGLVLCKDFVERHGGTIWAESKPGKGSTVFFSVPQTN